MALGLGASLGKTGVVTPGILTDNLVMKHMYPAGAVQPLSDGAAFFDASNSGVYLADPFNNQTFTVSAWIYRIDNGASQAIFSAQDSSTDGFMLFTTDDEHVRAKVNSTTTDEVAGKTSILANTWNHVVAMVTDNSKIEVYVNGVFGDDKALSGSVANTANARIGLNSYDTQNDYSGYICNVGYWTRLLTQAEIKSIMWKQYAGLTTSEKTSLVSWWNLDSVPQVSNSYRTGTNKGYIAYSEGASDHGSNIAFKDFVPTNDIELGSDIFGGEGSFTSDTGYWTLSNDTTISNGVVITDSGSGTYNGISKSSILTAGRIYKLSFDVIEANTADTLIRFNWGDYTDAADDAYPVIWSNTSGSTDTTGSYYMYFEPGANTATTFIIYCSQSGTGDYVEVKLDNIVCQEVLNAGKLT
jgi:hypothetical protein